jgi:hypothetical protein
VWFRQTRLFMTFIMAGSMALVMLFFMRHMYKDKRAYRHCYWERCTYGLRPLVGSQPGNGRGWRLAEGDDSAPLDSHTHK